MTVVSNEEIIITSSPRLIFTNYVYTGGCISFDHNLPVETKTRNSGDEQNKECYK